MQPKINSKIFVVLNYPSIEPVGDMKTVNGNYLLISTTDQEILVPSTGPAFQAYSAKDNVATIGEDFPCMSSLSYGTCSSTNETLHF